MAQIIFGWREFKFVQMKGPSFYQGEIITKLRKYINKFEKSSSQEPRGQFQPNLAQSILGVYEFISMKGHAFFQKEKITK